MTVLKNIDVISAAKIVAVINLIVGFIAAVIFVLFASAYRSFFGAGIPHLFGGGVLLLVGLPILTCVVGFVLAAIESWLYNVISAKIGGIQFVLKNNEVKRIEPFPFAKVVTLVAGVIGIVLGIIIALVSGLAGGALGAGIVLGIAIFLIIIVLVAAFIGSLVFVVLYNFLAFRIGGVKLFFKKGELTTIGTLSYAKIEGVFGVIGGLVEGVVYALVSFAPSAAATAMPAIIHTLGAFSIIVFPILYGVLAFLSSGFEAMLYNWLSKKIGGIRVVLK